MFLAIKARHQMAESEEARGARREQRYQPKEMLSQTSKRKKCVRGNKFTICIFTHLSYCCCASFNLLTEKKIPLVALFPGRNVSVDNANEQGETTMNAKQKCRENLSEMLNQFYDDEETVEEAAKTKSFLDFNLDRAMRSRWKFPLCHSHGSLAFRMMLMYSKQFYSPNKNWHLRNWTAVERNLLACESLPKKTFSFYFRFQFQWGLLNLSRDSCAWCERDATCWIVFAESDK